MITGGERGEVEDFVRLEDIYFNIEQEQKKNMHKDVCDSFWRDLFELNYEWKRPMDPAGLYFFYLLFFFLQFNEKKIKLLFLSIKNKIPFDSPIVHCIQFILFIVYNVYFLNSGL